MRFNALLIALAFIATSVAADPPGRAVRLNLTDGIVSFRPAGIDEWTDATVNRPLIDGDELWTDSSARAEMHVGSSAVRLAPSTSFGILRHSDGVVQLRLTAGTMNVRLRGAGADDVWEIDTPNSSVSLLRAGRYRIEVSEDGYTTFVTARAGEADVAAGGSPFTVRSGEQAQISGDRDVTHDISLAPRSDDFDRWCSGRDQREERIASLRYIPRDVVGYEDLDGYGEWALIADYGWGWRPTRIAAGWAPYRYGHWAWIEPWGWTWIDEARWGFAPFHYGRWAYVRGSWCWFPGKIVRPVYAPALVAFGGGAGWRVGVTVWWPLAPGEVYVPAYAAAPRYVRNINAPFVNVPTGNFNAANVDYRNRHVAGGVTAIPHDAFVGARPVAAATVSVSVAQALSLKSIGTTAPVAPRSTSVLGHTISARVVHPPQDVVTRTVIATRTPPPPPLSFRAKEEALTRTPGKPLAAVTEERLRVGNATPATTGVVVKPLIKDETPKRRTLKTPVTTTQPPPPTTTYTPPPRSKPLFTPPTTTTTTTAPATTTN
ncbi:MAG TPA: DUF6600 domain-containing protein, partial [Thermoanaerobaculia bacterium]|nr:DUF6600 domain-containing protein [Thermoanaerobaculia bacterium]